MTPPLLAYWRANLLFAQKIHEVNNRRVVVEESIDDPELQYYEVQTRRLDDVKRGGIAGTLLVIVLQTNSRVNETDHGC
jgi:hypothetical protein